MATQLREDDWDEVAWPYRVCEFPLSVSEIEKILDVNFFSYLEDGLGRCFGCYILVDNVKYFLQGYGDKDQSHHGVTLAVRSFEEDPESAIKAMRVALSLTKDKLPWVQSMLSQPRWEVRRKREDGTVEKVLAFHEKAAAEFFCNESSSHIESKCYVYEIERPKKGLGPELGF